MPITEESPLSPTCPYGRTKLWTEQMLADVAAADSSWRICLLRYFNPVGAHPSGRIGEDPRGEPNNLMPYLQQVAVGRRSELTVFGSDFPTVDGTGVRDYVHVMDVAEGHVAALRGVINAPQTDIAVGSVQLYNLGTGKGTSVLEMLAAFQTACGKTIPFKIGPRRPGEVSACWAATLLAEHELGWTAKRGLAEMCADQWAWASRNTHGFD